MSANKIIAELDAEQMTKDVPAFAPGDTVVAVSYTHLTLPTNSRV